MMVVKKDGRKQEFDEKKIARAIERAGGKALAKAITARVKKAFAGRSEAHSSEIREAVVKELQKDDERLALAYAEFQKVVRKLVEREDFLENRLIELVGNRGEVKSVYGGFHITVKKEEEFDYTGVLKELLKANQSISIERMGGMIVIVSK